MGNTKTILITGGAKRIGKALVTGFANAGWRVALHYHHSGKEAEALAAAFPGSVVTVRADLAQPDPSALIHAAAGALGAPLTALINNASVFEYDETGKLTPGRFDHHMAVNLRAPVLLTQAFAAQIPDGAQGVVINLLDQKLWAMNPDFFTYTLSKAGLKAATEMMAAALAPRVRVAGIAPGITLPSPKMSEANFRKATASTPLGTSSTPEQIAQAALFIAATPSYTGDTIILDGGEHLVRRTRDVMFDLDQNKKKAH